MKSLIISFKFGLNFIYLVLNFMRHVVYDKLILLFYASTCANFFIYILGKECGSTSFTEVVVKTFLNYKVNN